MFMYYATLKTNWTKSLRVGSLIAGLFFLAIGLAGFYYIDLASRIPFVGGYASQALGGVTIVAAVFVLIGLILTANGFRSKPTKLSIDEIKKLGLTGEQIKEAGAKPTIVVSGEGARPVLSSLELTILRHLSQGKNPDELTKVTGVDDSIISGKVSALTTQGYITQNRRLTERGFEAIQA